MSTEGIPETVLMESRRYMAAARAVGAAGCRCPLRWNGERVVPALSCELEPGAKVCPRDRAVGRPVPTFTGRLVYPLAPDPESIVIEDIAHHLSMINRFGGATAEPYSVAQHSVLVSYCCDPADALHGLLHDASEAYLGDVVTPLKQLALLRAYRAIEAQLQVVIYAKFGLAPETPLSVKVIDDRMAVTEAQLLFRAECVPAWARHGDRLPMSGLPIEPWAACCAEVEFLRRFQQLMPGSLA